MHVIQMVKDKSIYYDLPAIHHVGIITCISDGNSNEKGTLL